MTATESVSSRSKLTQGAPPPNCTWIICAHSRVRVVTRLRITRPRVDGSATIDAKRHRHPATARPQQIRSTRSDGLQPPMLGFTDGIDSAPPVKITTDRTDITAATRRPRRGRKTAYGSSGPRPSVGAADIRDGRPRYR